ncbi:DUF505 domain-containing protein [Thermodesulfobacterium hydrogeniphilum]|uniref:DUF505 domain-containing protein n=1 Tax=Thermodesulfobacterium hydrogeniphilum TaxID=161156 RepID=UPI000570A2A9|nr:DUF505 domain-containing protein [Thermodesulfobacterium hydrogeniphilum]
MIIRKEHVLALLNLDEAVHTGVTTLTIPTPEENPYIELELQGLIRLEKPSTYSLTYWSKYLVSIIKEMIKKQLLEHPANWEEGFRWIGSEVITMLQNAEVNDGLPGPYIKEFLEKRGFLKNDTVNEYGRRVLEIFRNMHPRLLITGDTFKYLKDMPAGPGPASILPVRGRELLKLEAMRLIAFSVPKSDIFTLTPLGRAIKKVTQYAIPAFNTIISEDIMDSLIKLWDAEDISVLTDAEKETLMSLGYINDKGEFLPAGEYLTEVYWIWKEGKGIKPVKTFNLEQIDEEILKIVDILWEKNKSNPEILPTPDEIAKFLYEKPLKEYKHLHSFYGRRLYQDLGYQKKEEIKAKFAEVKTTEELFKSFYEAGGKWYEKLGDVTRTSLYTLEAFNLVKSTFEKNKEVYILTEYGKEVLEDIKQKGVREIHATAVKAINMNYSEFTAPNYEWHEKAVEAHLVGNGEISTSGELYSKLAYNVKRLPHITKFEKMVLQAIPEKRFFVEDIYANFDEVWHEEIEYALDKLEARGFINILPNHAIVLTEAGKLIKRAIAGAPLGMSNPLTPLGMRILLALQEIGSLYTKEKKVRVLPKNWATAYKVAGLDPETFNKELKVLRMAGLVGTNSITEAGILALEAFRLVNEE